MGLYTVHSCCVLRGACTCCVLCDVYYVLRVPFQAECDPKTAAQSDERGEQERILPEADGEETDQGI